MSENIKNKLGGVGGLRSLDGAMATGPGTAYILEEPLSDWSLTSQLSSSTGASLLLEGSAASSSDAAFSTIMSVTASTSGETNSTSGFPAKQVRVTLDSLSSGGTADGWIAGSR